METIPNEMVRLIYNYVRPKSKKELDEYYEKIIDSITVKEMLCIEDIELLCYLMGRYLTEHKEQITSYESIKDQLIVDFKNIHIMWDFHTYAYYENGIERTLTLKRLYDLFKPNTIEEYRYLDNHRKEFDREYMSLIHYFICYNDNDTASHIELFLNEDMRLNTFTSILVNRYFQKNHDKVYNEFKEIIEPIKQKVFNRINENLDEEDCYESICEGFLAEFNP